MGYSGADADGHLHCNHFVHDKALLLQPWEDDGKDAAQEEVSEVSMMDTDEKTTQGASSVSSPPLRLRRCSWPHRSGPPMLLLRMLIIVCAVCMCVHGAASCKQLIVSASTSRSLPKQTTALARRPSPTTAEAPTRPSPLVSPGPTYLIHPTCPVWCAHALSVCVLLGCVCWGGGGGSRCGCHPHT